MVKFTIDEKQFKIPERFTIQQWKELMKWDYERTAHWPRIIHEATGAPIEYLNQVAEDSLELGIIFIATNIGKRKECKIKDFTTISFGEWVDLDVYLNMGIDKHITEILQILEVNTKQVDEALWVIEKYSEWRLFIYKQYSKLFGLDEPTGEATEGQSPQEVARAWYKIIVNLAGDDLLKIDAVTDEPLKKVFNFMALKKEKQLEETERQLKQQRQYDLRRNSK